MLSSQGFSDRGLILQYNPRDHQECFTRNKRDFCFQIWPRLSYDAMKEYRKARDFFQQAYGEPPVEEGAATQEAENAGESKKGAEAEGDGEGAQNGKTDGGGTAPPSKRDDQASDRQQQDAEEGGGAGAQGSTGQRSDLEYEQDKDLEGE